MDRYPKAARAAVIKCIDCNAPVVETVDQTYVCADCGQAPIRRQNEGVGVVGDVDGPR